jgi:hypothetical protein
MRYRSIRRTRKTQIWGNIALALEAFDRLEPLRDTIDKLDSIPNDVKTRIIAARQSVVDQYLRLLEQAALAEEDFTTDTVDRWHKNGRLQTEWRRQAAMNFVPTEYLPQEANIRSQASTNNGR